MIEHRGAVVQLQSYYEWLVWPFRRLYRRRNAFPWGVVTIGLRAVSVFEISLLSGMLHVLTPNPAQQWFMTRTHAWSMMLALLLVVLFTTLAVGVGVADTTSDEPFEIEITEADETIREGDTLQVTATITNAGNTTDSQQIHLKNGDLEIVDSIAGPPVTLAPGESETVTLSWEAANGDAGVQTFGVQSNTHTATHTVDVQSGAFYDVDIVETESPVTAGESMNAVINITNTGNVSGMTTLSIAIDQSLQNRTNVLVRPGETAQVTLGWNSTEADIGERTLSAYTTTGVRTRTIVVIEGTDESSGTTAETSYGSTTDTHTTTETSTSTAGSDTPTETTLANGPGRGLIASLLALFSAALLAGYWVRTN